MCKYSIRLLKKELKQWNDSLESEKEYYKDYKSIPIAKKTFRTHKRKINDLKEAIRILELDCL